MTLFQAFNQNPMGQWNQSAKLVFRFCPTKICHPCSTL